MGFALSEERERELQAIVSRYPNKMAACIPVLHLCQDAHDDWISPEGIEYVAEKLELGTAHVKGVVSFYELFHEAPVGKHQIRVCRTLACALRGGLDLLQHAENRLGIRAGETTRDGRVTLQKAECLASCGTAPVVQIDDEYHENLTVEAFDRILDRLLYEG